MPREEGGQHPLAGHLGPHQAGHQGHPHPQHPGPRHPAAVHHNLGQHQALGHHQSHPQQAPGCGCPQSRSCHPHPGGQHGGQDVAVQGAHGHPYNAMPFSWRVLERLRVQHEHVRLNVHGKPWREKLSVPRCTSKLSSPWDKSSIPQHDMYRNRGRDRASNAKDCANSTIGGEE